MRCEALTQLLAGIPNTGCIFEKMIEYQGTRLASEIISDLILALLFYSITQEFPTALRTCAQHPVFGTCLPACSISQLELPYLMSLHPVRFRPHDRVAAYVKLEQTDCSASSAPTVTPTPPARYPLLSPPSPGYFIHWGASYLRRGHAHKSSQRSTATNQKRKVNACQVGEELQVERKEEEEEEGQRLLDR